MDLDAELELASRKWNTGDHLGALVHYEKVLEVDASNAFANNGLGAILLAAGKPETSLDFFAKAIAADQSKSEFWVNLVTAQIRAGKFKDARALTRAPALTTRDDIATALRDFLKKAELARGYELCSHGDFESLDYCRGLASEYPEDAEAWNVRGAAELTSSSFSNAIESLKRAIDLGLVNSPAFNNLGVALKEVGLPLEALDSFRKSLEVTPDFLAAKKNQILVTAEIGDYGPAISLATEFLKVHVYDSDIVWLKSDCLSMLDCTQDAIAALVALESNDRGPKYSTQLAFLYQTIGDIQKSEKLLSDTIVNSPRNAHAYFSYRQLIKTTRKDSQFLEVERFLRSEKLSTSDRILFEFAQAKACKDLGEYDDFFTRLVSANSLKRKQIDYSLVPLKAEFKSIREKFATPPEIGRGAERGHEVIKPIFIVGLPRTGSTLIESVLSAHSEVRALGETEQVPKIMRHFNWNSDKTLTQMVDILRQVYSQRLKAYRVEQTFATDKTLANFFYLGFLLTAFPNATVIEVTRAPKASGLSMYERLFDEGQCEFSYSLGDLESYFQFYREVMVFWKSVFPDHIKSIRYEEFIEEQKQQTWGLLDHIGLPHERQCLDFSGQERSVRTASFLQVRAPLYKSSSDAWREIEGYVIAVENKFEGL